MLKTVKNVSAAVALLATLIGTPAIAQESSQAARPSVAWSLAKSVREENGHILGAWAGSMVNTCTGSQPEISAIDTSLLVRLTEAGVCNGQKVYFMMRRAQPLTAPAGSCNFEYVTVGGLIPGIFEEVAEKSMPPGALASFRQASPKLASGLRD